MPEDLINKSILENMGRFIKQQRLLLGKSQLQLAKESGIARSTLCLVEKGENTLLSVYIQLLLSLNLIHLLNNFQAEVDIEKSKPNYRKKRVEIESEVQNNQDTIFFW